MGGKSQPEVELTAMYFCDIMGASEDFCSKRLACLHLQQG
jgi:hypothetical protein